MTTDTNWVYVTAQNYIYNVFTYCICMYLFEKKSLNQQVHLWGT